MSFPRYPKYKPSGVEWLGEVPEHWETERLRFVAQLNPSKNEIAELDRSVEVSFLPMEAIGDDGSLDLERTRSIGEVDSGYTYFREHDVAVAKITPCFENGKGAIMRGLAGGLGFGTTELIVARPKCLRTTSEYLHWIFVSTPFRKLGESWMYGAGGQKRVPDEFVYNFAIAFPSLQEQKTIAAFLDRETAKIDALVEEQRRLIKLLKEKRQAVISHAVTKGLNPHAKMKPSGIEWLGDVPAHWDVKKFCHISTVVRGASPRPAGDARYFNGEFIPWITVGEITKDTDMCLISTQEMLTKEGAELSRTIECGTLVLTNSGATLGVPKILSITGCANDGILAFLKLHQDASKQFLYYYLISLTENLRDRVKQGSGQPNLNTDIVKMLAIPWPARNEQNAIVAFLDTKIAKFDILVKEAFRAIDLLQERRTALISTAVTGKIDVRGCQA